MLPWVVFAIIAAQEHGVIWAASGALIVVSAMLIRPRKVDVGTPNVLMRGALCWFGALAVAGAFATAPSSWLQRNAVAAAAIGFAIIAFASVLDTPFTEYWTRLGARQRHWTRPSFRRANVFTTMLWGTTFAAIAFSCLVATGLDSIPAETVFDWLLPLGLTIWAVHRTKVIWDDFVDDAMEERLGRDSLWDVGRTSASDAPPDIS
jgi:hypothetical protein